MELAYIFGYLDYHSKISFLVPLPHFMNLIISFQQSLGCNLLKETNEILSISMNK
uniref:Uncharacterized protein n=1 Tax=Nelumbo nucifera TaxID=4432 RepID=A0A822Z7A5_NELNU|nr:TPA_asm: hypothetical protein HUJ06_015060 [Nelumbo nucifera]